MLISSFSGILNAQQINDTCICLTPEEFQGSEILEARYKALLVDTVNYRKQIILLETDKKELGKDKADLTLLYQIANQQADDCYSKANEMLKKQGFNFLEVMGISGGVAVVTAIITFVLSK